ncbi:conserved hypothetical protein [Trichinella spiralis]|uniref:hypothetical protein n=1 Tax=Trichinella spiralis TaxID=6334 RepID=UPI0001EFB337|nr:conserved hypothetical protein [Trichinella spiralis]
MCIDLAGSEYITKLHYFGQKIETARDAFGGAVVSGLHAGEQIFKHSAFIRTAGGRLIQISDAMLLNTKQATALRQKYGLPDDYDFSVVSSPLITDDGTLITNNMLFAPKKFVNQMLLYCKTGHSIGHSTVDCINEAQLEAAGH